MQVVLLPNRVVRRFGCSEQTVTGAEVAVHCREVGSTGMMQKESPEQKARGLGKLGLWRVREGGSVEGGEGRGGGRGGGF